MKVHQPQGRSRPGQWEYLQWGASGVALGKAKRTARGGARRASGARLWGSASMSPL